MTELLVINVTYHTPQNRISDTITHLTPTHHKRYTLFYANFTYYLRLCIAKMLGRGFIFCQQI